MSTPQEQKMLGVVLDRVPEIELRRRILRMASQQPDLVVSAIFDEVEQDRFAPAPAASVLFTISAPGPTKAQPLTTGGDNR